MAEPEGGGLTGSAPEFCPRCRAGRYTPYLSDTGAVEQPSAQQLEIAPFPVLSRVANIYICSTCGTDEAMRDFRGMPPVPPDQWPIERGDWWLNQQPLPTEP